MNTDEQKKLHQLALKLAKEISLILEQIAVYEARNELSEVEQEEYRKLRIVVCQALPVVRQLADVFGHEAFQAAQAYFYKVQKKALEGNASAIEIYNELKPLYDQALLSQLDKN